MAKDTGMERYKDVPIEELCEKYRNMEIGADVIIYRLEGHGRRCDGVLGGRKPCNPSTVREISSTAVAARTIMRFFEREIGLDENSPLSGTEKNRYNDAAVNFTTSYSGVLESEKYQKAEEEVSRLRKNFIDGKLGNKPVQHQSKNAESQYQTPIKDEPKTLLETAVTAEPAPTVVKKKLKQPELPPWVIKIGMKEGKYGRYYMPLRRRVWRHLMHDPAKEKRSDG